MHVMDGIDLRRLQAFRKVYECRGFSRAGEELFLSQPTVSAHVIALERDLGARLFDRLGRSVLPTPAGEALYRRTHELFDLLDLAVREVDDVTHRVRGDLVVGASTIPAQHILPDILAAFLARHPEVTVTLAVGDSREIIEAVAAGRCVVGLVGAVEQRAELRFHAVLEDELICVAPPGLALPASPGLANMAGMPWILREPGSGTRRALEQALAQAGAGARDLRVVVEAATSQTALACVARGVGVTVTSRLAARDMLSRGEVAEVPLSGLRLERRFHAVHHAERTLFPAARALLDTLGAPLEPAGAPPSGAESPMRKETA